MKFFVLREYDDKKFNHSVRFMLDENAEIAELHAAVADRFELNRQQFVFWNSSKSGFLFDGQLMKHVRSLDAYGSLEKPLQICPLPEQIILESTVGKVQKISTLSLLATQDPWAQNHPREGNAAFKRKLAAHYAANLPGPGSRTSGNFTSQIRCLLLDVFLDNVVVCASCLLPAAASVPLLERFGMQGCIDSPQNGLLLFKPIEMAFSHGQITFIILGDAVTCIVIDLALYRMSFVDYMRTFDKCKEARIKDFLDPFKKAAREVQKRTGITGFAALHGRKLTLPAGVLGPFRRALLFHAILANRRAKLNHWPAFVIPLELSENEARYKQYFTSWHESMTTDPKPDTRC